ncbi:serine/threonine-protein phosphatase 6 regulatory ankyrin repeat subunit A-like [Haliotis cracherodii]|uniref:serine/threonine-protein phosphatase 6 regulatory ankyrin repeat subunit A-like n=1 Tax=Haliotis cracherodii TaxID=6455 RepID=UPI0039EB22E2
MSFSPPRTKRLIKTALHQAVLDCRLHQVRLLVSKHGANVDCRDINGRTPLMLSCMIDNVEYGYRMAKIFLKKGAHLNMKDNMGRTALSYACMKGKEEIVEDILSEDVLDINEPDTDGNTPLHHSALSGNPRIVGQIVDVFKRFGLNVDRRNNLGYTALLLACKNGNYVSAHVLFTKGTASPTLRDGEFYLNAVDWVGRSHSLQLRFNERSMTVLPDREATPQTLAFERETTMYQRPWTPICRHVKSRQNPLCLSVGSALRLPLLLGAHTQHPDRSETFIGGEDAREVLLTEMQEGDGRGRPVSTKTAYTRWSHPSTAKLRALTKRSNTIVPDMVTIFQIYSDQYQPDWRKLRARKQSKRAAITSGPETSTSDSEQLPAEVVAS